MAHTLLMTVMDALYHLSEVVPGELIVKPSRLSNDVEEFSTSGQIHDNKVLHSFDLAIGSDIELLVVVVQVNHIRVLLDSLQRVYLRHDCLQCGLTDIWFQNFDSKLLASLHIKA